VQLLAGQKHKQQLLVLRSEKQSKANHKKTQKLLAKKHQEQQQLQLQHLAAAFVFSLNLSLQFQVNSFQFSFGLHASTG